MLKTLISRLPMLVLLASLTTLAAPAAQAQVNPTASSVQEQELMRALQTGDFVAGRVSIPDERAGALIKPGNKGWAGIQGTTLRVISVAAVLVTLTILAAFYAYRGRIRIDSGFSGRVIERFDGIERFGHWLLACSFVVLALTGLNFVVGRWTLLPLVGEDTFGTLSAWFKLAHNFMAWPFMLGLVWVFVTWVGRNLPSKVDVNWLKVAGGLFTRGLHPPAGKFNAGQKLLFWMVILGGVGLSYTGVFMLFPWLAGSPAEWQTYQVIHALFAAFMSVVIFGHIYIGSLGMQGAFSAMGSGKVDLNWAKEHHSLWVEEEVGHGKGAAGKPGAAATPAE
ncbi:formate dehydrogenase subunit gamma [Rhodovulum strictum]|uniref:Formate dehydrogenase subunit gamma n=1 Tax=Rhodovulum strictum TaxID=58314 RepID=A0A844BK52_9RHOB|nr:formate dehydrogenase subunit gamma [Rhodovulum strictum]MRH21975.1 formate dehydrogenase subunit gamma [Rhodovulum strictum]